MSALKTVLAGGVAAAALVVGAPASAQDYPGYASPCGSGSPYGYGYGNGGSVGQVIDQALGNGYGGYGASSQAIVGQCVAVVQARLSGGNGGYGYSPYGNGGYGRARVLGISRVDPRPGGGLTVRGAANSGRSSYAYGGQAPVDLTFRCSSDYRGVITNVQVRQAQSAYGYNEVPDAAPYATPYAVPPAPYAAPYTSPYVAPGLPEPSPYTNDYSQYGYSRY